jgi:hypothetical protein
MEVRTNKRAPIAIAKAFGPITALIPLSTRVMESHKTTRLIAKRKLVNTSSPLAAFTATELTDLAQRRE